MIHNCFTGLHVYPAASYNIKSCSVCFFFSVVMLLLIHSHLVLFVLCNHRILNRNFHCLFNKSHSTFWTFAWFVLLHFRVHYTSINYFSFYWFCIGHRLRHLL